MLTTLLVLLAAGPGFRDTATSSVSVTDGPELAATWKIANVTYEQADFEWASKRTVAVARKTQTTEFQLSNNERPSTFVVEYFLLESGPKAKPVVRFEAKGDEVVLHSEFFEVRSSLGLSQKTELFDLSTQKRFLVASPQWHRVVQARGPELYVGYETVGAKGVHGRLVLTTTKGAKSEVTFQQKEGGKVLHWGPVLEATKTTVRLRFQDDGGGHVVDVPMTDGKLNGKEQSIVELP